MFPSFSFPLYESDTRQEINPHQILLTLLNMKSQQSNLQPFLSQQQKSTKFSFLPQTPMMQNSFQNSLNEVDQLPRVERINPHKAQLQPPQLDFQLLRSLRPMPFAYKLPSFELSSRIERSAISESDSEAQQEKSEQIPQINVKLEETQIKCEEYEHDSSHRFTCETEKVSASKKIGKCEKNVNTCGHPERKHYAKGMCNNCYHKYGRVGKPDLCEHDVLYAKGLCQKCYLVKYNQQKALSSKKKKKVKRSNKSKKSE